jgi:hypothetical protein
MKHGISYYGVAAVCTVCGLAFLAGKKCVTGGECEVKPLMTVERFLHHQTPEPQGPLRDVRPIAFNTSTSSAGPMQVASFMDYMKGKGLLG